jgi:hypothetical protein
MFRFTKALLALCLVGLLGTARLQDQAPQNPILSRYFVAPTQTAVMDKVAEKFEVQRRVGNGFDILVPVNRRQELLVLVPNAILKTADTASDLALWDRAKGGFHTFDSVKTHLDQIVAKHSEIASADTYGKSMEGRSLHVLRLATKVGTAKKPQIAISSATHGDELITVEVVFGILEALVNGYGKDPRITKIVDNYEIFFLPVINPDGYIRQQRYSNGIDPNRDYPYPEHPNKNSNPAIKAVMNFFQTHEIKGSIDYHSTGGMIMYPWAYTYSPVPADDKAEFHAITSKMAEHNHYVYGPISKVIYVAKGSSADYYYWKYGTRALGIEIRLDGSPSLVPKMVQENLESTLRFIESF